MGGRRQSDNLHLIQRMQQQRIAIIVNQSTRRPRRGNYLILVSSLHLGHTVPSSFSSSANKPSRHRARGMASVCDKFIRFNTVSIINRRCRKYILKSVNRSVLIIPKPQQLMLPSDGDSAPLNDVSSSQISMVNLESPVKHSLTIKTQLKGEI